MTFTDGRLLEGSALPNLWKQESPEHNQRVTIFVTIWRRRQGRLIDINDKCLRLRMRMPVKFT